MTSNALIALASVLTALGATAAAVVAAYALRAQQRGQQRQHDLENLRWMIAEWARLSDMRKRATRGFLAGTEDRYALREVLNFHENCGFIVREGFIRESTFTGTVGGLALSGWWHSSKSFIESLRTSTGNVHLYEHLEWLKDRLETEPYDPSGRRLEEFLLRESGAPLDAAAASDEV